MTDPGEKGIDGIAILINDRLILNIDDLNSISEDDTYDVRFVFIQSKTSDGFSGDEIGTFIYGVKAFFTTEELKPKTNPKMESLIALKDEIYKKSVNMTSAPVLEMYYVTCGKWYEDNGLDKRISLEIEPLEKSQDFSNALFYPYDSDKIITTYKELKKKISRTIAMEKRTTFPSIDGIKQAYLGLVRCKDFIPILCDSDGNMLNNIFEDNVRDFQGYNPVNSEIQETLNNNEDQNRFAVLNNGITIMAKTIKVTGDNLEIYDYQIVNGCQTSYVLYDNKNKINDKSYLIVKVIEVENEDVSDRVIYTTNRQTEVKSEAFTSTKRFHKELQDFYNSISGNAKLYYERRSKQYDLDDSISKTKVISLSTQTASYIAMFLNEPHSTHRYYGELLRAYNNKIYLDTDAHDPYYISAYLNYFIESGFKNNIIDKKYKTFKFHILCAIKTFISGPAVMYGKARQQKKECEKYFKLISNNDDLLRLISKAITCIDHTLSQNTGVPKQEQHRSREITTTLIDLVEKQKNAKHSTDFLKPGDTVQCTVSSINSSFINVDIKTEDSRNYGSIHISQVAKRYIEDLTKEVSIGEIFETKILKDDFYESSWGWSLTKLF